MRGTFKMFLVFSWFAAQIALTSTPAHASMHGNDHGMNYMTQSFEQGDNVHDSMGGMHQHITEDHSTTSENMTEQDTCCDFSCQIVSVFSDLPSNSIAPSCGVEAHVLPIFISWLVESNTPPPNTLL